MQAVPFGRGFVVRDNAHHETSTGSSIQFGEESENLGSVYACFVETGDALSTGSECCGG